MVLTTSTEIVVMCLICAVFSGALGTALGLAVGLTLKSGGRQHYAHRR
jgi:transketolase N-terminal domain/subunit